MTQKCALSDEDEIEKIYGALNSERTAAYVNAAVFVLVNCRMTFSSANGFGFVHSGRSRMVGLLSLYNGMQDSMYDGSGCVSPLIHQKNSA